MEVIRIQNEAVKIIVYFIARWIILLTVSFCFLLFAELDLITLSPDFIISFPRKIAIVAVSILLMPIGYFFLKHTEPTIRESAKDFFVRVQRNLLMGTFLYTIITALGFFLSLIDTSGAHRPITIAGLGLTILTGGRIRPICTNYKDMLEMEYASGKRSKFG